MLAVHGHHDVDAALGRMKSAGADAFNRGAPCVPGLDVLWARELYGNCASKLAYSLAHSWRHGWKQQAALVERVLS